ncbi:unnamed protein product [Amoebophrya sp. A25]|nr:unnamed protein product [Amoebophrya sp. A25]|eukprot:GSA25T00012792001.1
MSSSSKMHRIVPRSRSCSSASYRSIGAATWCASAPSSCSSVYHGYASCRSSLVSSSGNGNTPYNHSGESRRYYAAYSDSSDRRLAIREKKGIEILEYFGENADIDISTLQEALKRLGQDTQSPEAITQVANEPRFHTLLGKMKKKVEEGNPDALTLAKIADSIGKLRFSTPELEDLTATVATAVKQRPNAFSPRNLSQLALALSARKLQDPDLVEFVRMETLKCVQDVEPAHANALLEAFRRWGFFDRRMHDMIIERMTDEVDRFSSRDICDALKVLSDLGLVRGFLLRRLAQLAFENLRVFTPKQRVGITYSLARLRFLVRMNMDDVLDHLRDDLEENALSAADVSKLFFSISMLHPEFDDHALVKDLASRFLDQHRKQVVYMIHLIDAAWAIVRFKHVFDKDCYAKRVEDLFSRIFSMPVARNRVLLAKLFEVVHSLEQEEWRIFQKSSIGAAEDESIAGSDSDSSSTASSTSPSSAANKSKGGKNKKDNSKNTSLTGFALQQQRVAALGKGGSFKQWKIAADETDGVAQSKNESSRLHAELVMKLEHTFHRRRLHLVQNQLVANCFRVDIAEQRTKLVVDIDAPNRAVNRVVKHRILAKLGYSPVQVSYWRWRQCKSDEEQAALLEKSVGEKLPSVASMEGGGE